MKNSDINKNFRPLTRQEISDLINNNNQSDNWENIYVTDHFTPRKLNNNIFNGAVYIGDLGNDYNMYQTLKLPVGISYSRLESVITGDNVSVHNASYISNIEIGDNSVLFNIGELTCSGKALFGHGQWLDIANENGGKKILSFNGMREADAALWSAHREDALLMDQLQKLSADITSVLPGKGRIGNNSVIKHLKIMEDCQTGPCAIIDGSSLLKNLTINSSEREQTFIGNNVELENGIVGYANTILSGADCQNFITGRNVTIKLAARVLHSFVGSNSTIACCEVLNNLLFPLHEQHHNNSFLIASTIAGQSNIAAGATIGSNHNSRAADGEIICGRGFWPGLNSSFKHNSRFASFSLVAKASYESEMNIDLPFSLISKNKKGDIQIFPGFWFRYNMYALARNSWKFKDRDKRYIKDQHVETDYLAPDTLWEMLQGIKILENALGGKIKPDFFNYGKITETTDVFLQDAVPNEDVFVIKPVQGLWLYKAMIAYAAAKEIAGSWPVYENPESLQGDTGTASGKWINLGGQLITENDLSQLILDIRNKKLLSWQAIHERYDTIENHYKKNKAHYAVNCFKVMEGISVLNKTDISRLLKHHIKMDDLILQWTIESRHKDYTNTFRKMVYKNEAEMEAVIGSFSANTFINNMKLHTEKNHLKIKTILEDINGK